MSVIINEQQLQEMLTHSEADVVMIDVRNKDDGFDTGLEAYTHSHIPGAVFLDIKKDLTGEKSFVPHPNKLAKVLGEKGISEESTIVIYDQGSNRPASKAWFVFYYLGHKKVYLLEGGFRAWVKANNEVTDEVSKRKETSYKAKSDVNRLVDMKEIKRRLPDESSVLIDSRSYERFIGKVEPKYKKAGHIPGAKNFYAKNAFAENGEWKSKQDLQKHFSTLKGKDEIIVSCGSGNSACMNLVALKAAGFDNVKLYPGGFSEWISYEENEVAQGKDE